MQKIQTCNEFTEFVQFQCDTNDWDLLYIRPAEMQSPIFF